LDVSTTETGDMVMTKLMAICCVAALVTAVCGCEKKNPSGAATPAATTAPVASADRCPHEIKPDKCPFCTPSLVASDGFCGEHGVAEALCYQCRPYLKTAFKAKGDWCAEHDAPESQCVACHPELKEAMKEGAGHGK